MQSTPQSRGGPPSFANTPISTDPQPLRKALGIFAVMASAVAAEYGSGVNTLLSSALGANPNVTYMLPWAVLLAGFLLLPSVLLYARFSRIISTAGSAYVWMTTALGPLTGFIAGFVYFVGVLGSMGFLAYVFSTFISTFCSDLGASDVAAWCLTAVGKLTTGILLIALTLWIHLRGAKQYGKIISLLFFGVLVAAGVAVYYGLTTDSTIVVSAIETSMGQKIPRPASDMPTAAAVFSVVTLFVYLYGGISAAPSLGGESENGGSTLSKGLIRGWMVAVVLYAGVAFAMFHAVPWWTVHPAVAAGKGALMTIPGLVGIMAPLGISVAYKGLIIIVAGKTIAPLMFDCSRNLYAWSLDGHVPKVFSKTNSSDVPGNALITVAILTVIFLTESVFGGFQIGVALRAISLVLVSVLVAIGAVRISYAEKFSNSSLKISLMSSRGLVPISIATIAIGLVLIYFGIYQHGVPLLFQPGVQGLLAAIIAFVIFRFSKKPNIPN